MVAAVLDVRGPALDERLENLVLGRRALQDDDVAFFFEHPRDAPSLAHVSAEFFENLPQLRHGAGAVVRQRLKIEGDASGRVALVDCLLVAGAAVLAEAATDRRR